MSPFETFTWLTECLCLVGDVLVGWLVDWLIDAEYSLDSREDVVRALRDIHLAIGSEFYPIRRGEFVMLRGPSGGGKTTLLNILGTIDLPTDGSVGTLLHHMHSRQPPLVPRPSTLSTPTDLCSEILGSVIDGNSPDNYLSRLRLEKIGFVFQTFNLLATMSAFENVELPMTILGKLSADQRKAKTKELLTRTP